MGLPAPLRLRSSRRIRQVAGRGRRSSGALGQVAVLPGEGEASRLCVVLPRRIGTAVVRNRIRRRVHEGFRALVASIPQPWDIVLRTREAAAEMAQPVVADELAELLRRVGVLERHADGRQR